MFNLNILQLAEINSIACFVEKWFPNHIQDFYERLKNLQEKINSKLKNRNYFEISQSEQQSIIDIISQDAWQYIDFSLISESKFYQNKTFDEIEYILWSILKAVERLLVISTPDESLKKAIETSTEKALQLSLSYFQKEYWERK